jgi:hydrogenase-4 component B
VIQLAFYFLLATLAGVPVLTWFLRRWDRARYFVPATMLVAVLMGATVAVSSVLRGVPVSLDFSSVGPFAFTLTVDRLSAFFLFLICFVAGPVIVFFIPYAEHHYHRAGRTWIWILLPLFLLSMVVVATASSAFAFLFGWELMTLFSAGLILVEGDSPERRHDLMIYLLMMHVGAAAVVACYFLFLPYSHSLDFAAIRGAAGNLPPTTRTLIFLLAFIGFGTKAGIIPLHLWLPRAHPIAPSPVSALMSGVMLKTAVYGFVRFGFDFLGGGPAWWGYLVLFAGAVSGILGVLYALSEQDLKRLLAYSSIENIGIIFLGLGTALIFMAHDARMWATLALIAALLHTLNHAIFKSLLFLGAGAISNSAHTLDLEELGGLQKRMPFTGATFLIACGSIAGLPLFSGFISEWLTFRSFLAGSTLAGAKAQFLLPLMTGALGLIGGLGAACFIKAYGIAFLGRPRSTGATLALEVPTAMRVGMMVLATACLAIGILPGAVLQPLLLVVSGLIRDSEIPPDITLISRTVPLIAVSLLGLLAVISLTRRNRRAVPTWACGLPELTSRMEYTSTAFSKPIRWVFSSVYRPDRKIEVSPADSYFPASISYRSVRTTSFEKSLYRPAVDGIVSVAHQLRRLHTGNIQFYLLYIFLTLVGLLAFLRIFR